MLALASVLILPFSSNFPELYTNHYLLCNCLLSAMLVFIVSLGDNFAFLPVFKELKKVKKKETNGLMNSMNFTITKEPPYNLS